MSKARILIVEDNPQNMRLFEMVIGIKGYTLLTATDGEEALKTAIREHPDLIIMDIQLPGMDGLEVTRKLRENSAFSRIPIIAVTAYAMSGDKEKAIAAGCNAYMTKPFNIHELYGMITEMLLKGKKNNV